MKSPGCPGSGLGLSVASVLQCFSDADTVPCPGLLFVQTGAINKGLYPFSQLVI